MCCMCCRKKGTLTHSHWAPSHLHPRNNVITFLLLSEKKYKNKEKKVRDFESFFSANEIVG